MCKVIAGIADFLGFSMRPEAIWNKLGWTYT